MKRFPRTTAEAFRDAEYANPWDIQQPTGYPLSWWVVVIAAGLVGLLIAGVTA